MSVDVGDFIGRGDPSIFVPWCWSAFELTDAAAADAASASDFGKLFSAYASELGLSAKDCESSGPMINLRKVAKNAGSKPYILRNCDAILRPFASGVGC